ncbi:hypothetical protein D3C86_1785470 [compost metagenome]
MALEAIHQRCQHEKHREPEQAQAMDHRIEHVGAHGGAVRHRLHGSQFLQRPKNQRHHCDLHHPNQQPFGAGEGVLGVAAETELVDHRQHHVLEYRGFHLARPEADPVSECVPHYRLPSAPCCWNQSL